MSPERKLRVLVADDEEILREVLAFEFRRRGHEVVEAANGHEAFELISANPVDVVVTDVRMPDGDGVELLQRIKAHDIRLPVVIFITALTDLTHADAYDMGVEAIFSKPFDRKALLAVVERLALPVLERLAVPPSAREVDADIVRAHPDPAAARAEHAFALGRGGFFTGDPTGVPAEGRTVAFQVHLGPAEEPPLAGVGVVRWRREQSEGGLHAGAGIEFGYLEDPARRRWGPAIVALDELAFIPRD